MLQNEHGVAKAVETILPGYGFLIGLIDKFLAGKGGNHHQQRRPRQVKIGNKGIYHLESKSRQYEQAYPALKRLKEITDLSHLLY